MNAFGALGYGTAAVFYTLLSVLLLVGWRGGRTATALLTACLVSIAWAAVLALQISDQLVNVPLLFASEVLRGGAWVTFLTFLVASLGLSASLRLAAIATWIVVLIAGTGVLIMQRVSGIDFDLGEVLIPGGLAISLVGLVLTEQLIRNSPVEARWGIKPLALGIGGLFAYDLFLYSQSVLFGVIDNATLMARGAVNALFIPFIAVAARRNSEWNLDIFVSRNVIFYSTTLIAVGLYLLLMSIGAYALMYFGSSWGAPVQIIFFVGALLVLMMLLFSGTLRARARVFLTKHFFRNKYDYRAEWLRLVATMADFEDSSTRQVVIKAIAQIVNSPSGVLWILDADDRVYRVAASYATRGQYPDIPIGASFVEFMKRDGWLIDLHEYARDPDIYSDLEIPDWVTSDSRIWLIVPLFVKQSLFGLIILHRGPVTVDLNFEDRDLLKTVGNHIAVHLIQEQSDNMLAEAQQFQAYNRLTAFLMHDLNNLIAQQSLIVANAEAHKRNPDFIDDAIATIASSVERMRVVMERLKRGGDDGGIRKSVNVDLLVSSAVARCTGHRPGPEVVSNAADIRVKVDPEQCIMIIAHLIRNAQDATPSDGRVSINVEQYDDLVAIQIIDTGSGMSPDFVRDRLFRPFDSTKGSLGMGIGAYQSRDFARRHGGDLKIDSELGRGTRVSLTLPSG